MLNILFIAPFYLQCALRKMGTFHRERLRIDQETLQISVFVSMFLSLVKKTALHFLFAVLSYVQGATPPTSQSMSKEKSRNIANISIQSCITKFSQKCFILSVYYTALCTERFEPPPFTELCYMQGAQKKLKIASFTDILKDFGYILQLSVFHTMLLNLVFYTSFFTLSLLSCIVLCARCASNEALHHLHRTGLRKNLEAPQIPGIPGIKLEQNE